MPIDASETLIQAARGNRVAAEELLPLVYDQLREVAARQLRRHGAGHTLQPTALVHEAYFKLIDQSRVDLSDRTHFLALSARIMRQILVDHARAKRAVKRGGGWRRVLVEGVDVAFDEKGIDLIALDEALQRLADLDARKVRVVELRFFAGLSIEQTARQLGVSHATVENDWRFARAWLRQELGGGPAAPHEGDAPTQIAQGGERGSGAA